MSFQKTLSRISFYLELISKNFYNPGKIKLFLLVYPYTMVGYKRLANTYELANLIERQKIIGDFVECGVWRGGCSAVMAYAAKNGNRKTWLFDSFEGLPEPTKEDGLLAKSYSGGNAAGGLQTINKCVGPIEDVKEIIFDILKIKPENVVIKKGWFQDVLPEAKQQIKAISILRLDGDWYESTKCCLDNLYDLVTKGGYVIVDDYGHWEGSRRAVDEFFAKRKINPALIKIDYTGVYFKKP